jgi:hypothetical protein
MPLEKTPAPTAASSCLVLDHKDPTFEPLDHTQLNDCRRRIVTKGEVDPTDEEIKHAIQTFLFHDREAQLKLAAPKTKAPRKKAVPKKDITGMDFDDLLNAPVKP